ncbi:MAG TPA: hypothetical protein VF497_09175 [Rudaea sp.]
MKGHLVVRLLSILLVLICMEASAGDCTKDQYGNVVCGKGQCASDQYNKTLCAKEGGGAIRDRNGVVKCGIGFCAIDDVGRVMCSSQPGGGAAVDSYGKVKCQGTAKMGRRNFVRQRVRLPWIKTEVSEPRQSRLFAYNKVLIFVRTDRCDGVR